MIKSNKNLINKIVIAVAEYFCSVCHAINCARHMSRVNFILHQKNCCVWRSQCVQNLVSITVIIHWNGELLANCLVDYWKKKIPHQSTNFVSEIHAKPETRAHAYNTSNRHFEGWKKTCCNAEHIVNIRPFNLSPLLTI